MSYLLTASTQVVNLLVLLCDVLATANITEERSLFMSPKGMILDHMLADLKNIFFKNYLKILDYHDGLIISSYQISMSFAEKMKDFETKLTDNFVENLKEDINGNIIAEIKEKESVHSINLNFTHKPSRKATTSKIEAIQQLKEKLKESMIKNMVENVVNQNQADTIVEFASAFDMRRLIDLDVRIKYIKKLHALYGTNYIHEIRKVDDDWKDYNISLLDKRKLNCSEKKITHQFRNLAHFQQSMASVPRMH